MAVLDFVIAGAQKAGTTTLHVNLARHPEIFLPRRKEQHFFDTQAPVDDAALARYARAFDAARPGQLRGEATPIYMYYPGAMDTIRRTQGAIKVVVLLRHPVHRAYSHYWHEYRLGWESLPFEQALMRRPRHARDDVHLRHHSYVDRSCYTAQLERIEALFGADKLLVVMFEDLVRDPLTVMNRIVTFLGPSLLPLPRVSREAANVSRMPRSALVHGLFSGINILGSRFGLTRRVIPSGIFGLNLTDAPYPPISRDQFRLCRDLVAARDPALFERHSAWWPTDLPAAA